LWGDLYYTGHQALEDNPYLQTSGPYVIIGALVERHVGPARLVVNFENITDVRQTKYRLVLPERAPDGRWTTDTWAPLEGRVLIVELGTPSEIDVRSSVGWQGSSLRAMVQ
jgi:outer membrane receptor for ferrienterochelin and colicins